MKSYFNYTGRREIKARHARLSVDAERRLDALFDFADLKFPPDAKVVVEALSAGSSQVLRLDFGTIGVPMVPPNASLATLPGDNIYFRVKVVDAQRDAGRLLGLAPQLRPRGGDEMTDDQAARLPILPLNVRDLGEQVWRLNFADGRPCLDLNSTITGLKAHVLDRDSPFFYVVFPELIRRVLERLLVREKYYVIDNDDSSWQDQWLRFAVMWHPERQVPAVPQDVENVSDDEAEEAEAWIDAVVGGFCSRKNVRLGYEAVINDEGEI